MGFSSLLVNNEFRVSFVLNNLNFLFLPLNNYDLEEYKIRLQCECNRLIFINLRIMKWARIGKLLIYIRKKKKKWKFRIPTYKNKPSRVRNLCQCFKCMRM